MTCDPRTELQTFVDLTIAPAVGPEVIAGSTRLKAGTATKIVLNMLTTGAMVRIGKTYGNLMVDVQTGSEKRRDRARRIITIVTGLEYDDADKLLRQAHWNVKAAIVMKKTGLSYPRAVSRLRKAHDVVRDAIGEDVEARLKELSNCIRRVQGSRFRFCVTLVPFHVTEKETFGTAERCRDSGTDRHRRVWRSGAAGARGRDPQTVETKTFARCGSCGRRSRRLPLWRRW